MQYKRDTAALKERPACRIGRAVPAERPRGPSQRRRAATRPTYPGLMLGGLEKLNLFDVAAGAEKLLDLHLRGIPGDLRDLGNL